MSSLAIVIEKIDGKLIVKTPYHPDFVTFARKHKGKFVPGLGGRGAHYVFDPRSEEAVRAACLVIFGADGSPTELVDIKLRLAGVDEEGKPLGYSVRQAPIFVAGRQLASASGRDSGARFGDGVVILEGGIGSGGSVKNWRTGIKPGTVFELRDLPAPALETIDMSVWEVEVLRRTPPAAEVVSTQASAPAEPAAVPAAPERLESIDAEKEWMDLLAPIPTATLLAEVQRRCNGT